MISMLIILYSREEIKAEMIIFEKTCEDPKRFAQPGRLLQEVSYDMSYEMDMRL